MGSAYQRKPVYLPDVQEAPREEREAQAAYRAAGHDVVVRPSKKWTISYVDTNGITQFETAKSNKATRDLLKLREGAVARRERIVVEDMTFADGAKALITNYEVNKRRSLTDLKGRLKHLEPFFGKMKLGQITTSVINAYVKHRQAEDRVVRRAVTVAGKKGKVEQHPELRRKPSNAQINRETQTLHRIFALARHDDKALHVPHVPKLKEPKQPRKGFFEHADFLRVRDHLDPQYRNIAGFMFVTGWRVNTEVLPLEWRNVNFNEGTVRIDPEMTKSEDNRVFPMTKALRQLLKDQEKLTAKLKSSFVFCHLDRKKAGKRMSEGRFYKGWLRAIREGRGAADPA